MCVAEGVPRAEIVSKTEVANKILNTSDFTMALVFLSGNTPH